MVLFVYTPQPRDVSKKPRRKPFDDKKRLKIQWIGKTPGDDVSFWHAACFIIR